VSGKDERRREREGLGGLLDELVRETVLPGSPGHFEFGSAVLRLSLPEAHAGANAWERKTAGWCRRSQWRQLRMEGSGRQSGRWLPRRGSESDPRNQAWAPCSCSKNPDRGGRNWSPGSDSKATLVRPPGLGVDGAAVGAKGTAPRSTPWPEFMQQQSTSRRPKSVGRTRPPCARCAPAVRPLACPGTPGDFAGDSRAPNNLGHRCEAEAAALSPPP